MIIRFAVNNIARDVLTAAEGGEEVGEIVADAFVGAQCLTDIKVLDEGVVVIVILKVMNDPVVDRLHLFGIVITVCTNFVSMFFRLCVPQSCTSVNKIGGFRLEDEIVCRNHRDQNESRYY